MISVWPEHFGVSHRFLAQSLFPFDLFAAFKKRKSKLLITTSLDLMKAYLCHMEFTHKIDELLNLVL